MLFCIHYLHSVLVSLSDVCVSRLWYFHRTYTPGNGDLTEWGQRERHSGVDRKRWHKRKRGKWRFITMYCTTMCFYSPQQWIMHWGAVMITQPACKLQPLYTDVHDLTLPVTKWSYVPHNEYLTVCPTSQQWSLTVFCLYHRFAIYRVDPLIYWPSVWYSDGYCWLQLFGITDLTPCSLESRLVVVFSFRQWSFNSC